MVYAIAAYSITIGCLALYGLTIRHREREATAALLSAELSAQRAALGQAATADVTAEAEEEGAGATSASGAERSFNVGAALLAPLWMLAHGLRGPGVLVTLACLALWPLAQAGLTLPFWFVAMIPIAAGAALGFVGNRIASQNLGISDPAALSGTQLPWALGGILFHAFVLPWIVYFF